MDFDWGIVGRTFDLLLLGTRLTLVLFFFSLH